MTRYSVPIEQGLVIAVFGSVKEGWSPVMPGYYYMEVWSDTLKPRYTVGINMPDDLPVPGFKPESYSSADIEQRFLMYGIKGTRSNRFLMAILKEEPF